MALDLQFADAPERMAGRSASDLTDPETPESLAVAAEARELVAACLGGLTMGHTKLIEMRYGREMGLAAMAAELGVSVPAVSRGLRRAEARLRRSLELMGVHGLSEVS